MQSHIANASTQYGRADLSNHLEAALAESKDANHSLTSTFVLSALNWIPYFGSEIKGARHFLAMRLLRQLKASNFSMLSMNYRVPTATENSQIQVSKNFNCRVVASSAVSQKLERPVGDLFGPVGRERASFNNKLAHSVHDLNIMRDALTVGRSILGDGGTSTVLVLPENNAEMRDQGAILSYSLMSVHGTAFSVLQSGHSYSHDLSSPLDVPLSPGAKEYFEADGVTQGWRSVNLPEISNGRLPRPRLCSRSRRVYRSTTSLHLMSRPWPRC